MYLFVSEAFYVLEHFLLSPKYFLQRPVKGMPANNFPLQQCGAKTNAPPFVTVAVGSSQPPSTPTKTPGRCAYAALVHAKSAKRLEPKLLHAVMIMLMVTTAAADAAAINMMLTFLVLVMLNVMVMRMLMMTPMAMMWLMLQVQT